MNPFEEAYRKVIAEGLAKWTLRSIAGIFSLSLTAFLLGYTTVSAAILVVALSLTLLLAAYVFGWVASYRKTRQRIDELEKSQSKLHAMLSKAEWQEMAGCDNLGNIVSQTMLVKKSDHDT